MSEVVVMLAENGNAVGAVVRDDDGNETPFPLPVVAVSVRFDNSRGRIVSIDFRATLRTEYAAPEEP